MKAYSLVLLILVSVLTTMLVTRKDVTATITRASGQLYQKRDSLQITNLYNIKVANKTHEAFPIHLKLENIDGDIQMIGKELSIDKETLAEGTFFIVLDRSQIHSMEMDLEIGVYSDEKLLRTVTTSFFGPVAKK